MMRAERGRPYRGRKPRGGPSGEQVMLFAILVILAVLVMSTRASSEWSGMTPGEQMYQALFVTKDWE